MQELGVIEPSSSECRSYPVMVPKPDGQTQVCLDFHKVNKVSEFNAHPMPRIQELIDKLGKAAYLLTLDNGYWQIPLSPESKAYTAFATPVGLFQFVRMPFALHGTAATFQRLVDRLLHVHTAYAAAYIDDVIVFSNSWEEHLLHLKVILEEINKAGQTVNPEKCRLGANKTQYLGFTVREGKVEPVSSKIQIIEDIPPPQSKRVTKIPRNGRVL